MTASVSFRWPGVPWRSVRRATRVPAGLLAIVLLPGAGCALAQGVDPLQPLLTLRGPGGLVSRIDQVTLPKRLATPAVSGQHAPWLNGTRRVGQTERSDLYSSVSQLADGAAVDIWHVPRAASAKKVAASNAPVGRAAPVMRSRLTLVKSMSAPSVVPRWWPALSNAWSGQSREGLRQITTMLGWHPQSLRATSRLVHGRARSGGLLPVRRVPLAADAQSPASELLVFAAPNAELVVTLTAETGRVGVVAHWIELVKGKP